jgi:hypothetical protein
MGLVVRDLAFGAGSRRIGGRGGSPPKTALNRLILARAGLNDGLAVPFLLLLAA